MALVCGNLSVWVSPVLLEASTILLVLERRFTFGWIGGVGRAF